MILDTSAVVGILLREHGHAGLAGHVTDAVQVGIGAPTLVETEMVLVGRLGLDGKSLIRDFVLDEEIEVLAFDGEHAREAGRAFARYGKGRHPAGLNYGDCMTYATARLAGEPLLCLGDDFAKTDLELLPPG